MAADDVRRIMVLDGFACVGEAYRRPALYSKDPEPPTPSPIGILSERAIDRLHGRHPTIGRVYMLSTVNGACLWLD
jgi:hypothetical protein